MNGTRCQSIFQGKEEKTSGKGFLPFKVLLTHDVGSHKTFEKESVPRVPRRVRPRSEFVRKSQAKGRYFYGRQCAFLVKMKISGAQVSLSTEDERSVSAGFDFVGTCPQATPGVVIVFATQRREKLQQLIDFADRHHLIIKAFVLATNPNDGSRGLLLAGCEG